MPDANLPTFDKDRDLLKRAARDAGTLALRYFNRDPQVWTKGNDSPVTEADLAVDKMLHESLLDARKGYGWLSEETEDNQDRLDKQRVFVVDPIDGTRAFIDGGDEWTISVAVVENGRPVAAALYAPVRDEMFLATKDGGATLNGAPLVCPQPDKLENARAAGPGPVIKKGLLAKYKVSHAGYIRSLAYRIVMVATDAIDLALARGGAHDWDLAACDLILQEAGGILRDQDGKDLVYNRQTPKHEALYATPNALAAIVEPLIPQIQFPMRH